MTFAVSEPDGFEAAFRLRGSNGYSIYVDAFSERADGRGRINLFAVKKGHDASYTALAEVTPAAIHADLGSLGAIDAVLHPSGREKTARICGSGPPLTFEPGLYRGTFRFKGEEGYTRADQSSAALRPFAFFGPPGCGGGGSGEELNSPRLPGARLRGLSFTHGRALTFQLNKNRPGGRMRFSASLRERHGEVLIHRDWKGAPRPPPSPSRTPCRRRR